MTTSVMTTVSIGVVTRVHWLPHTVLHGQGQGQAPPCVVRLPHSSLHCNEEPKIRDNYLIFIVQCSWLNFEVKDATF